MTYILPYRTSALLTPVYVNAEDKPSPIRHLNAFAALVMVASLHHHIFGEYRLFLPSGSALIHEVCRVPHAVVYLPERWTKRSAIPRRYGLEYQLRF